MAFLVFSRGSRKLLVDIAAREPGNIVWGMRRVPPDLATRTVNEHTDRER